MTDQKQDLEKRAIRLEYLTIAWNVIEMTITIALGIAAASLALVAFGLDTMVELFASGVVVWHLRHPGRDSDRVTALALRLVAFAFAGLALVVSAGAIWALATHAVPDESPWGIAYMTITVLAMLLLGLAKRADGLQAPQRATDRPRPGCRFSMRRSPSVCCIGLVANAAFGWWWADPLAALLVSVAALNEAKENLEEARELV